MTLIGYLLLLIVFASAIAIPIIFLVGVWEILPVVLCLKIFATALVVFLLGVGIGGAFQNELGLN